MNASMLVGQDKQRVYDAHNRGENCLQLGHQIGVKRQAAYPIVMLETHTEVGSPTESTIHKKSTIARKIVLQSPKFTMDQINQESRRRFHSKSAIRKMICWKHAIQKATNMQGSIFHYQTYYKDY